MNLGRRLAALALWAAAWAVLLADAVSAATVEHLYQAQTIVTGSDERNRGSGMATCLAEVLVKVSGDPRLLDDPAVARLAPDAPSYVESFRYRDRMEGIPTHDEQGSRDRPYDLIVDFVPEKIDALLRSLGREPWPAERPRVMVFLAMRNAGNAFVLAQDGPRDLELESIAAAAARRGVPIALPDTGTLAAAGLTSETLGEAELERLEAIAKPLGGNVALAGTMRWDEQAITWVADWRLHAGGSTWRWQASSETFDEAFRQAMGSAAQLLSGNGEPL